MGVVEGDVGGERVDELVVSHGGSERVEGRKLRVLVFGFITLTLTLHCYRDHGLVAQKRFREREEREGKMTKRDARNLRRILRFLFLGGCLLFASCLVAATVVCFVCQDYVWRG